MEDNNGSNDSTETNVPQHDLWIEKCVKNDDEWDEINPKNVLLPFSVVQYGMYLIRYCVFL